MISSLYYTFVKFGIIGFIMSIVMSIDAHIKGYIKIPKTVKNYRLKLWCYYGITIIFGVFMSMILGYLSFEFIGKSDHFIYIMSGLGGILGRDLSSIVIGSHIDKKYFYELYVDKGDSDGY